MVDAAIRAAVRARVRALGCASDDTAPCPRATPFAPWPPSERRADAVGTMFLAAVSWATARAVEVVPLPLFSGPAAFDALAVVAVNIAVWMWPRGESAGEASDA